MDTYSNQYIRNSLPKQKLRFFPRKLQSMKQQGDRVSNLPDDVLHNILSLMPMKQAIRTSILSRRWRYLWRNRPIYALILNTTAKEFVRSTSQYSQSQQQFVGAMNHYVNLNRGRDVDNFQLFFYPGDTDISDYETWIKFAIDGGFAGGVKVLDLDGCHHYLPFILIRGKPVEDRKPFKLPSNLFSCGYLTHLRLSRCHLNLPSNFTGLESLQALYLDRVNLDDKMLQSLLSNCQLLENLSLIECNDLDSINISGSPNLNLKRLTVVHCYACSLEISAPNLQSLHFNADVYDYTFNNVALLEDAIISAIGTNAYDFEYNRTKVLSEISHVKILSVCTMVLLHIVDEAEIEQEIELPITFPNLLELQIWMESADYLSALDAFFTHYLFPCLEKLFIELEADRNNPRDEQTKMPMSGEVLNHVKAIKITNFNGGRQELELVQYLLEKAVILESLVLVGPKEGIEKINSEDDSTTGGECDGAGVRILREQLAPLALGKTSSNAQVIFLEYLEDDKSLHPTHTQLYYWT
ncbi:hypothetical protein ACLOJK_015185 [Asimina triloba]